MQAHIQRWLSRPWAWVLLLVMLVLALYSYNSMDFAASKIQSQLDDIVSTVHIEHPDGNYASFGWGYKDVVSHDANVAAPLGVSYRLSAESGGKQYWMTAQGVSYDACVYLLGRDLHAWDNSAVRVNGMVLQDKGHIIRDINIQSICSHAQTPGIAISWLLG